MNNIEKRQLDIITEMLKGRENNPKGDFSIIFTGSLYQGVIEALTEKGHMVEKIDCKELLIRNGGKPSFLITPGEVVDETTTDTAGKENSDKPKYDTAKEMDERISCLVDEEDQEAPNGVLQYLKKAVQKGKDTADKGREAMDKVKTATSFIGRIFDWIGKMLCKIYAVGDYPAAEPNAATAENEETIVTETPEDAWQKNKKQGFNKALLFCYIRVIMLRKYKNT